MKGVNKTMGFALVRGYGRALALVLWVLVLLAALPASRASAQTPITSLVFEDEDDDHVYFNNDDFGVTVNFDTEQIPNDTTLRVVTGVITDPDDLESFQPIQVLQGMQEMDGEHYVEQTVAGGSITVSGQINNPGNETLPTGVVGFLFYFYEETTGSWEPAPEPMPVVVDEEEPAIVGIKVPSGNISVSPGLHEFNNLYDTEKDITFTRQGVGRITFGPGLDIVGNRAQLMQLQTGVTLRYDASTNTLSGGIDGDSLGFLAAEGAIIKFFNAMDQLGLSGVTSTNFRDHIQVGALDDNGDPVSEADLPSWIDLDGMSYDEETDTLAIPVNHFSTYTVKPAGGAAGEVEKGQTTRRSRREIVRHWILTGRDDPPPVGPPDRLDLPGNQVDLVLDGKRVDFDVQPFLEKGRTMIPARQLADALGYTVYWDGTRVRIWKFGHVMFITPGENQALVDGVPKPLDAPARVVDGRIVLPLRFIAENFGLKVLWKEELNRVVLY